MRITLAESRKNIGKANGGMPNGELQGPVLAMSEQVNVHINGNRQ
jgi:hypothetical protein